MTTKNQIQSEKVITLLRKQGIIVNVEEAAAIVSFFQLLAEIYLYELGDNV